MRISAIMILFALFAGTSGVQAQKVYMPEVPADYGYIVNIGQQVPDIEMVLTDGTKVKMSDLKGKVVMLQFTASWCSVCRKEMPHIEKEIWKKYRKNSGFALYGIDMDEPIEKVVKFGKDIGITYPMVLDPGGKHFYTFAAKGAGVTRNVIIDKSGKIVFLTRLYKEDEFKKMKEVIADLLK